MYDTRSGRYGENLAIWINWTINAMPEPERESYKHSLIAELKTYSLKPRKKGSPPNEGCKKELDAIKQCSIDNPVDLAKLVKEGIHLMYQKQTSARVIEALINTLESS